MEKPLLNDPQEYPTQEVLRNILDESYGVYEKLMQAVTDSDLGLEPQWNFYKDGKAWLCKVCFKKKTIFWLSIWDKCFKIAFYFTEKHKDGIAELDIDPHIKEDLKNHKPIGRLLPLPLTMNTHDQIKDVLKLASFKKSQK